MHAVWKTRLIGLLLGVALGGALAIGGFWGVREVKAQNREVTSDNYERLTDIPLEDQLAPQIAEVTKSLITALALNFLDVTAGVKTVRDSSGYYSFAIDANNSLLGLAGTAIGYTMKLPVSGEAYLQETLSGVGLVEPAYAQGYGYASLAPIMMAWRIFRNAAYVLLTLVILVVGIMILFSQKLDGQLTLTVQKALPQIILSLIMITFSYAIVGMMIDAMYLAMYLFGSMIPIMNDPNRISSLMGKNILGLGGNIIGEGVIRTAEAWWDMWIGSSSTLFGDGSNWLIEIFKLIFNTAGLGLQLLLVIVMIIVMICVMIGTVWKLFKILLKSYVMLVLNTIFAPMRLLMGAFPGSKEIGNWLKTIIGYLVPYVAVFVIMMVYYFLQDVKGNGGDANAFFAPPFLAGNLVGSYADDLAFVLLGLGVLMTLPELTEKFRDMILPKSGMFGDIAKNAGEKVRASAGGIGGEIGGDVAGAVGALAFQRPVGRLMQRATGSGGFSEQYEDARKTGPDANARFLTPGWFRNRGRAVLEGGRGFIAPRFKEGIPNAGKNREAADAVGSSTVGSLMGSATDLISGRRTHSLNNILSNAYNRVKVPGSGFDYETMVKYAKWAKESPSAGPLTKQRATRWHERNPNDTVWASGDTPYERFDLSRTELSNYVRETGGGGS